MVKRICNDAEVAWICANSKGLFTNELTERFNEKFGRCLTESQIHGIKSRHGFSNGLYGRRSPRAVKASRLYSDAEEAWLYEHMRETTAKDLAKAFNREFGRSVTDEQIKSLKARRHWDSGFTGRFKKGRIPWNKGLNVPGGFTGTQKTQFKKGRPSWNKKPVGSERINVDGYVEIKIAEPHTWKLKHRIVWEKANGAIPKNYAILFLDGNKLNFSLDNLAIVTKFQVSILNKKHLISSDPKKTKAGILISEILEKGFKRVPYRKRKKWKQ